MLCFWKSLKKIRFTRGSFVPEEASWLESRKSGKDIFGSRYSQESFSNFGDILGTRRDRKLAFGGLELNFTESKKERSVPLILMHQQSSTTDSITVASACVNDILRDSLWKMSLAIIKKRPLSALSNVLPKDNKKDPLFQTDVQLKENIVLWSMIVHLLWKLVTSVNQVSHKVDNSGVAYMSFGGVGSLHKCLFPSSLDDIADLESLLFGFPAVLSIARENFSPKIKEVPNRFEGSYNLEVVRGSEAIRKTRAEVANGVTDHRRPSKGSMQGHEIMKRRPCKSHAASGSQLDQAKSALILEQEGSPDHF
ncbi:hypothetical protein VNO77_02292 [Canavalia gladiata]|uniref:Uncharacterized protein n=1 Tax=Canavalia gladiata TaxID=3824 RepID=A0AAN9MZ62_CANGL